MKRKPNWFENKVILTEKQFRSLKEGKQAERAEEAADAAEEEAVQAGTEEKRE